VLLLDRVGYLRTFLVAMPPAAPAYAVGMQVKGPLAFPRLRIPVLCT